MQENKKLAALCEHADALRARVANLRSSGGRDMLHQTVCSNYRLGTAWASNALEGCSYTLADVRMLLEEGLTPAGEKPFWDALAVLGLAQAYDHSLGLLKQSGITEKDIRKLHAILGESPKCMGVGCLDKGTKPGKYRTTAVRVTELAYDVPPAKEVPARMAALCFGLQEESSEHPLLRAVRFHKDFVFIHPFADGNGRVARLAMNLLLLQQGYLPVVITPEHKREYVECLEKAHEDDSPLVEFILRREIGNQKLVLCLLDAAKEQSLK